MPTNCKNCGAVLVNGKCEYCKADYAERKPKLTQAQFDEMKQGIVSVMVGRGGLYASVAQASFQKHLSQFDLSDVEEAQYIMRLKDQPVIVSDPLNTINIVTSGEVYEEAQKRRLNFWQRLLKGE